MKPKVHFGLSLAVLCLIRSVFPVFIQAQVLDGLRPGRSLLPVVKKWAFLIGTGLALILSAPAQGQTIAAPGGLELFLQGVNDNSTTADTHSFSPVYPLINLNTGTLVSVTDSVSITFSFDLPDTTTVDTAVACVLLSPQNPVLGISVPITPATGTVGNVTYTRTNHHVDLIIPAFEYGEYLYEVQLQGGGTSSPKIAPSQLHLINL